MKMDGVITTIENERDEKFTQDYLADWAREKGDGIYDPDSLVEAMLGKLPPGPRLPPDPLGER